MTPLWHMTPSWAAEAILDAVGVRADDRVLEPCCGLGSFLAALPAAQRAAGIELSPELARQARRHTAHRVYTGDCLRRRWPFTPTLVVTNPPFKVDFVNALLHRAAREMAAGGRVVLLLSVHLVMTAERVLAWSRYWDVRSDAISRLIQPLVLLQLTRRVDPRAPRGFLLLREAADQFRMPRAVRRLLGRPGARAWPLAVAWAIRQCPPGASLPQILRLLRPRRPLPAPWHARKIRQVLRQHFVCRDALWYLS